MIAKWKAIIKTPKNDSSDSPGGADEDDDHSEDNDSSTCASEKVRIEVCKNIETNYS